jgi:predicted nucleotidyltransferase
VELPESQVTAGRSVVLDTKAEYWAFVQSARQALERFAAGSQLEVVGSLARGDFVPPYCDIDLLVIAPAGEGQHVRDLVPEIAAFTGDLLTIFVDPFCTRGTFCSIYRGPLKVDWFVAEVHGDGRRAVWAGHKPPPYDRDAHPWDWLWWLWCKVRSGKYELVSKELSKLWLFLSLRGTSSEAFSPFVPDPDQDDLERLILATMSHLPAPEQPVACEVRSAIEKDSTR